LCETQLRICDGAILGEEKNMNQSEFRKLRIAGQLFGGIILTISIVLMISQKDGLYLLAGYLIFWLINYPLIHGYIGRCYVHDESQASRSL